MVVRSKVVEGFLRRRCRRARPRQGPGVAEHGLVKAGLGLGEGQIGGAAPPQRRQRVGLPAVPGAPEFFVEMFETLLRQFGDERVTVGEMAIGRGAGDADPFRRLGQGETGGSALGNQRPRRRKQGLAQTGRDGSPALFRRAVRKIDLRRPFPLPASFFRRESRRQPLSASRRQVSIFLVADLAAIPPAPTLNWNNSRMRGFVCVKRRGAKS